MAEEAEEEGGEAGEEEKKGLPIKLILIVVGVLALAGGGYFAYTNFFQEESVEVELDSDIQAGQVNYEIDGVTKIEPIDFELNSDVKAKLVHSCEIVEYDVDSYGKAILDQDEIENAIVQATIKKLDRSFIESFMW